MDQWNLLRWFYSCSNLACIQEHLYEQNYSQMRRKFALKYFVNYFTWFMMGKNLVLQQKLLNINIYLGILLNLECNITALLNIGPTYIDHEIHKICRSLHQPVRVGSFKPGTWTITGESIRISSLFGCICSDMEQIITIVKTRLMEVRMPILLRFLLSVFFPTDTKCKENLWWGRKFLQIIW